MPPQRLCQSHTDRYSRGYLQLTIGLNTGSPMKELEKGPKEQKGSATPWDGMNNIINQQNPPELPGTKTPTSEYTWRDPWLQLHM